MKSKERFVISGMGRADDKVSSPRVFPHELGEKWAALRNANLLPYLASVYRQEVNNWQ